MAKKQGKLRVAELFAGVGGFRLGLEGDGTNQKTHHQHFETIWFNQWEPSTTKQHAYETYVKRFGKASLNHEYTNIDIAKVTDKVPDHDLLVGGFPCQDYSVAKNLSVSTGLEGKKGVLWWSIYDTLVKKGGKAPQYIMLENVDRLLSSPAKQRGRDFAIMLSSLNNLGYVVEWRIVNAAEYGFPQRRRRIFIIGYKTNSPIEKKFRKYSNEPQRWLSETGLTQSAFPAIQQGELFDFTLHTDPAEVSDNFAPAKGGASPFQNGGIALNHRIYTARFSSNYDGPQMTLGDFILPDSEIPEEYFITNPEDIKRWTYLKGAKKEPRKAKNGFEFIYSEGPVAFPDPLNKPSRTIITSEGGVSPSRFKHVIKTKRGLRRLTPLELERLCMFPENHTEGHTDTKRAFFMGNALVVGVIDKLGENLSKFHFE